MRSQIKIAQTAAMAAGALTAACAANAPATNAGERSAARPIGGNRIHDESIQPS